MKKNAPSKVMILQNKGVKIPNPQSVQIGEEVNIDRISDDGVIIYAGCKIFGSSTLILRNTKLGYQAPVTIENCQLGPEVELNGGFFKQAVFLKGSKMGLGAHVREGTILEEEANAAHMVGLKQTILFPYVTLGSLINFCDCLMAGGTSRKDHSEVGSSYIHFNYTPNQDKATPSLIGDVPHGVMLNQRPIFLGGQGGLVGPCRLSFGTVTAAGTICRKDELHSGRLIVGEIQQGVNIPFIPEMVPHVKRIVKNNVVYIANLIALMQWHVNVRTIFIDDDFPRSLYDGLVNNLYLAIEERLSQFKSFCEKLNNPDSIGESEKVINHGFKKELYRSYNDMEGYLRGQLKNEGDRKTRDLFLKALNRGIQDYGKNYLVVIKGFDNQDKGIGTQWLKELVDTISCNTLNIIPSFRPNNK